MKLKSIVNRQDKEVCVSRLKSVGGNREAAAVVLGCHELLINTCLDPRVSVFILKYILHVPSASVFCLECGRSIMCILCRIYVHHAQ